MLSLTDHLSGNVDAILDILGHLGFSRISHNKSKNEVRFSREEGSNPTSVRLNLDTLYYTCFSTNEKGNLYTLVMKKEELSFPQSLEYITSKLGLEKSKFNQKIHVPFGGFYKKISKEIQEPEYSMKTYDESILEPFIHKYNTMFWNDGINFQTQEEFKVGYDLETNRITIPIWTLNGKLCGVMGRLNDTKCEKSERWLPIYPCSRSLTLYGFHMNYQTIQEKGLAIIGEAEKMVQQMHSMGSGIGLAIGGCDISSIQAKYIKGLMIPKIILGFDEGLEEENIREQAKKLIINNQIFQNRVGYIWDSDNEILPKDSKMSPTDLRKEGFQYLVKKKVRWLE